MPRPLHLMKIWINSKKIHVMDWESPYCQDVSSSEIDIQIPHKVKSNLSKFSVVTDNLILKCVEKQRT